MKFCCAGGRHDTKPSFTLIRTNKKQAMKKFLLSAFALTLAGSGFAAADQPAIVPVPQQVTCNGSKAITLTADSRISIPRSDKALRGAAELFSRQITQEANLALKVVEKPEGDIRLAIDPKLGEEAYRLDITKQGVDIRGGAPAGVFYGLQTLRQLLTQYGPTLPAMKIEDAPSFGYRGAMLDCSRHFFTVDEVKTFIDMLALHKINRFHWHLTDDQGWRIEIHRYPELTRVGSQRAETVLGHNSPACDGIPYGGYYTQKQIREVVAYAAERFVTVVPEIEMPGHASAALTAYPWLGCAGEGYEVQPHWGVFPEVFCAGKDSTFEFMQNVLAEVIELFPSEYIHVGGDECPKDNWKICPNCQKRIRDEKLKDEHGLQSYFVLRMEKWLNEHGRHLIGWDEILEGGISKSATIMSWRGAKGGIAAARSGNKVIMTPNTHCYLDYYQTEQPLGNEPWGIGGYVSVEKAYSLDPYDQLTKAERPYILGVQGNIWTEYMASLAHVQHMVLPRIAALAEVGWAYDRRDINDFRRRMENLRKIYERCGYRYAPYFFEKPVAGE